MSRMGSGIEDGKGWRHPRKINAKGMAKRYIEKAAQRLTELETENGRSEVGGSK